jgi:hypothetical protein
VLFDVLAVITDNYPAIQSQVGNPTKLAFKELSPLNKKLNSHTLLMIELYNNITIPTTEIYILMDSSVKAHL